MAAWHLSCRNCNQRLARFDIEDDFENLYLPARPDLLKGGKEFECPNCGHINVSVFAEVVLGALMVFVSGSLFGSV